MDTANSKPFTLNSYTQNLASVLADDRAKSEANSFFTRQWGDYFVPKRVIKSTASSIPNVRSDQFRQYLATTAKNHRHYVKTRRLLRRVFNKQSEQRALSSENEIPSFFYFSAFRLDEASNFESVFLEPRRDESDQFMVDDGRTPSTSADAHSLGRPESCGSLTSLHSLQNNLPIEASGGRFFRPYQALSSRLEYYHDSVSILLSTQLTNKGDEFWRAVSSYASFHSDLELAIQKTVLAREALLKAKAKICGSSLKISRLQYAKENRILLLNRLYDISCLRDVQSTVQMLLNQDDFPKALECIATAQDVLNTELRGILCFRHLNNQLDEMTKAISKMLQEEFVAIIQREFAKPIENESECSYQEAQLGPVTIGLLRCQEFRFIQVLRSEIIEAIKNIIRQLLKNMIIESESDDLIGLDPSNLADNMNRFSWDRWMHTLKVVFDSLVLICRRVLSIQQLILESIQNVQRMQKLRKPLSTSSLSRTKTSQFHIRKTSISSLSSTLSLPMPCQSFEEEPLSSLTSGIVSSKSETVSICSLKELEKRSATPVDTCLSKTHIKEEADDSGEGSQHLFFNKTFIPFASPSSILAMPCKDLDVVREVVPCLIDHAIITCEERIGKLITARSKGNFLENCDPQVFILFCRLVWSFTERSHTMLSNRTVDHHNNISSSSCNGSLSNGRLKTPSQTFGASTTVNGLRSPLLSLMQQQTVKLLSKFFEKKRQQLSDVLDTEMWLESHLPSIYQFLIDRFQETQILSDYISDSNSSVSSTLHIKTCEANTKPGSKRMDNLGSNTFILLGQEKFVVVGASLMLIRILSQYCDLLLLFTQSSLELLLNVIELLKNFNSRTCQLILGAGALQLVGLKTISVKNLALASRSLQLVLHFIPVVRDFFFSKIPSDRQNFLRHFDKVIKDYNDHIDEISSKLLNLMEMHLLGALQEWKIEGKSPTQAFQLLIKQIGKFYSGYSGIMPAELTTAMLHKIHKSFKIFLKQNLQSKGVTPHDSLSFGMASQDFDYYMENMRAFPDCKSFPEDTLCDIFQRND